MSANPSEQERGLFSSLINDWESGLHSLKQRAVLGAESVRTRSAPIKQKGVKMARATREMSFLTKVEVGIATIGVVTAMTELIHAFPYAVGLEDPKDYHPLVVPAVLGMFENMFPPVSSVEDGPIPIPTLVPVTPEGTPLSVGVFPPGTAVVEGTEEVITVTQTATETPTVEPTGTPELTNILPKSCLDLETQQATTNSFLSRLAEAGLPQRTILEALRAFQSSFDRDESFTPVSSNHGKEFFGISVEAMFVGNFQIDISGRKFGDPKIYPKLDSPNPLITAGPGDTAECLLYAKLIDGKVVYLPMVAGLNIGGELISPSFLAPSLPSKVRQFTTIQDLQEFVASSLSRENLLRPSGIGLIKGFENDGSWRKPDPQPYGRRNFTQDMTAFFEGGEFGYIKKITGLEENAKKRITLKDVIDSLSQDNDLGLAGEIFVAPDKGITY